MTADTRITISELIAQLEETRAKHGDLPCCSPYYHGAVEIAVGSAAHSPESGEKGRYQALFFG